LHLTRKRQAAWKLPTAGCAINFSAGFPGESVGFVWDDAPRYLNISPSMSRTQLVEAHRQFYTRRWQESGARCSKPKRARCGRKMLPAQSNLKHFFAHPLSEWGVRSSASKQRRCKPMTRDASSSRHAARQYQDGEFFY